MTIMSPRAKGVGGCLAKTPTGIRGFDDITNGGLPKGRPTLIVGGPGSGKTLFSMQFLVNGALKFGEPGVFISFEETEKDLAENVTSLGFDLETLESRNLLAIDHIKVEADDIVETGAYDLEGLFVRIGYAIDSTSAKRVVLDTIESIFSCFKDNVILRSELRRLFRFLKDKGVTAIVTGEKGDGTLTRNGLEEYVSDAVVVLDNRVIGNIATRRLRVVKYRGSAHGSNEFPFLIDDGGFSVLPLTSLTLTAVASNRRLSTGIADLDEMFSGKGYFEGSTILISGPAGTGKTSLASEFVSNACTEGKKALFITFEESASQIIRNMGSIGIGLGRFVDDGSLRIHPDRATSHGLEFHLVNLHKLVDEFDPEVVVIDPVSSLMNVGERAEVQSMLVRMIDYLKMKGVTTILTDLKHGDDTQGISISSLVDTWIGLLDVEKEGVTRRLLRVVKSRGMAHSTQTREFFINANGIAIMPADASNLAGRRRRQRGKAASPASGDCYD